MPASTNRRPPSSRATGRAAAFDAASRIEGRLLGSPVQFLDGPHRGGVAGWLGRDGRPELVYLEISGYYLTAMA